LKASGSCVNPAAPRVLEHFVQQCLRPDNALRSYLALAAKSMGNFTLDAVRRVGDALVWGGPEGTKVLAHLDAFGDASGRLTTELNRIDDAVAGQTLLI